MKAYFVRVVSTNKIADIPVWGAVYEGADGKERAEQLAAGHNKIYPNDQWFVTEEAA